MQIYTDGEKIRALKREKLEEVTNEFIEILKTFQQEHGDEPYFGGENFGFVEVAFIPFYCWFHT